MAKKEKNSAKKTNVFFPEINDLKSAKAAAAQGVAACIVVIVFSAVVFFIATASSAIAVTDPRMQLAIVELIIYGAIAVMIHKMSRVAAIAGCLFYVAARVFWLAQLGPKGGNVVMMIFFTIMFINGIRGTFAYHRMRSDRRTEIESADAS